MAMLCWIGWKSYGESLAVKQINNCFIGLATLVEAEFLGDRRLN
ncbi:MAG: hypothetical protein RLZZ490_1354 [Cyanobacteriota bacterium]